MSGRSCPDVLALGELAIHSHDRRPATIVDVAREAGVSFKTVSRVLNGEPNVREPTRERVLAAAKQITSVEVEAGKVKFIRNREPITIGGYLPRLARRNAKARLAELRKLLLSL